MSNNGRTSGSSNGVRWPARILSLVGAGVLTYMMLMAMLATVGLSLGSESFD